MNLAVFENDKSLSLNGINKVLDDVYNDNLNFLLKSNQNELERREIDQFSYKIENLLNSVEEEGLRRHTEMDKMKETFQTIALQLKNVKKSIKKAEKYLEKKESGEIVSGSYKTFESIKKSIADL
ncbi:hypothetical protein, conserved [Plasmodium gonderi]|uniref:Uncharacterized protein n=1 Tax=Plasmodium gonderi TaxID=77519 RepID=A0A1Y1JHF7_PLAGO|nr:hypothetical protein, conserved [Plasmodium gonderi]GAW81956.1 hypothetical protein, conserved [Plasmodium gonderi]